MQPIPDNKFFGANMGLAGADRTQVGLRWATWTLLSEMTVILLFCETSCPDIMNSVNANSDIIPMNVLNQFVN